MVDLLQGVSPSNEGYVYERGSLLELSGWKLLHVVSVLKNAKLLVKGPA